MSFVKQQVVLAKSGLTSGHSKRVCSVCEKTRVPEGGIEMAGKWVCAVCWVNRVRKRK